MAKNPNNEKNNLGKGIAEEPASDSSASFSFSFSSSSSSSSSSSFPYFDFELENKDNMYPPTTNPNPTIVEAVKDVVVVATTPADDHVLRKFLKEQLVPTLLNIAQSILLASAPTSAHAPAPALASAMTSASIFSYRADGLDIDLNQPGQEPDGIEENGEYFDLNEPLPPEEKNGDEDEDNKDDGASAAH
ncbi:hypothetical protein ACOSQ4_022837 [Xanthoceras sorbifolium]